MPFSATHPVKAFHPNPFFFFFFSSMATLSDMFELEIATVHSIISKMIINEELMVTLRGVGRFLAICFGGAIYDYRHPPAARPLWTSPRRRW